MKAIAYVHDPANKSHVIVEGELPEPELREHDVLVEVRAAGTNPVDYKVGLSRTATGAPVVVGWDFAGIVRKLGSRASGFAMGDEVWGAGDITRTGAYAERLAVDSRIIAKKPRSLSFAEAAALPLTSLTAWEALIARPELGLDQPSHVLVIGGAGGVGSIAIQLLKALTKSTVVATASRPETSEWCRGLGADHVVDHHRDLAAQVAELGIAHVDAVLGTSGTDRQLPAIASLLRPFGHLTLIDDPAVLDIVSLKRKSISVHWELMFTKSLFGYELESQGDILREVAGLVDAGKIRSTLKTRLTGLDAGHVDEAHRILREASGIGKTVIEFG
jgi:zinc-binding alcohol dehydrogenase family protein